MNFSYITTIGFFALFILISCNTTETKEIAIDSNKYFEGEIKVSETRGIYGKLLEVNSTYLISENMLKREQRLGGVTNALDGYAGIMVDLKKNKVVLYYSEPFTTKKTKHTLTVKEYKNFLEREEPFPMTLPSPVDNTFQLIPHRSWIKEVKDTLILQGFKVDYNLYKDSDGIVKQETYDTKKIKVKRELLEMVFMKLPKNIHFLLKSEFQTSLSEQQDIEKISDNKWVDKGFKVIEKGINISVNITTKVFEISKRELNEDEFSIPSGEFKEISDLDDFIKSLPVEGGYDD